MDNQQRELVDEGIHQKQHGHYDLAMDLYNKAINMGDQGYLSKAYYNKGVLLHQHLSKPQEALECYEKAVMVEDDYQKAWHNIGTVWLHLNKYSEALRAFQKSLELAPLEVFPLFNVAYTLNRLNRQQEALDVLISLEEREIQRGDVYDQLGDQLFVLFSEFGNAYLASRNVHAAYSYFKRAYSMIQNKTSNGEGEYAVCYNIAFIADMLKDYEKALEFYDKVIAMNANESKGYQGKACTYIHTKQYQQALPLIHKAISLAPGNFEGYYNLACIYAGLNDRQKMLDAIQKTIVLAPKQIGIQHHIQNDPDFKAYCNDEGFLKVVTQAL